MFQSMLLTCKLVVIVSENQDVLDEEQMEEEMGVIQLDEYTPTDEHLMNILRLRLNPSTGLLTWLHPEPASAALACGNKTPKQTEIRSGYTSLDVASEHIDNYLWNDRTAQRVELVKPIRIQSIYRVDGKLSPKP